MKCQTRLFLGLLVVGITMPVNAAGIKCWINNSSGRDVKECGTHVPPEFAQQGHSVMDSSGAVTQKSAPKTAEEIFAAQKVIQEKKLAAEKQAAIDRVLTDTFANECDLIRARDGKLIELESHIISTYKHIDKLKANKDQIDQQAQAMKTENKAFQKKIENVVNQIKQDDDFISTKRKAKVATCEKYAADTKRFRELKKTATPVLTSDACGFDMPTPEEGEDALLDRCELN